MFFNINQGIKYPYLFFAKLMFSEWILKIINFGKNARVLPWFKFKTHNRNWVIQGKINRTHRGSVKLNVLRFISKNPKNIDETEPPPSKQNTPIIRLASFRITKTPIL